MSHAETLPLAAPSLTAVLFGLSGCLVDFGARARQHSVALPEHAEATPGALDSLHSLQRQQIPCAWLDELPPALAQSLVGRTAGVDQTCATFGNNQSVACAQRLLASLDGR